MPYWLHIYERLPTHNGCVVILPFSTGRIEEREKPREKRNK
jgi:hypothetical protein